MATSAERAPTFDQTVEAIRARRGRSEFDTLIGLSGGLDSSYALVIAVRAGLKVLAMHCDTGWNSREGVANIESLCSRLSVPLETYVVDWEAMQDAQRAFFLSGVPNCDIPQDHAIASTVGRLSSKFRIRTFLSGSNWVAESILPAAWGHGAQDLVHLRAIWKRFGNWSRARTFPTNSRFRQRIWQPYIRRVGVWPVLNDVRYDPRGARQTLLDEYGWQDYGGKHCESVFTRAFQCVYLPMRYGFDKRRAHVSSLIIAGLLTRDEALEELKVPPMTQEAAERDAEYLCEKLRFTAADWARMISSPPVPHEAYPIDQLDRLLAGFAKRHIERRLRLRRSW